MGSTGICYAFRCHVDELPQTIFHKGIFKTALSENWCSACDLDCVFYVFYRTRGTIAWTGWRAFSNSVINFSIVPVYWFFPPLFMVYLSLPVLSLLVQNRKILWYMTVLAFASCSVFPFVCTALGLTYWGSFAFPMMGGVFTLCGTWLSSPYNGAFPVTTQCNLCAGNLRRGGSVFSHGNFLRARGCYK